MTSASVKVSEKSLQGTVIYKLSTYSEGQVVYMYNTTKTKSSTRQMFKIGNNGVITLNQHAYLDYESGDTMFELYIYSQNNNSLYPVNSSNEFNLVITLIDVNDNSPVFNTTAYSFSIMESANISSTVGSVFATDADGTSVNIGITYFLLNDVFSNIFEINKLTGEITVSGTLDYDVTKRYNMAVCSSDNATDAREEIPGNEARSTCVPVTINVLNVNGHLPTFSKPLYSTKISEKAPNGLEIFRFSATDGDHTPIYFQYNTSKTSAEDMATFELNNVTGLVTLNASKLDFEIQSKYFLYVFAIDSVSLLKGDNTELVIELIDINDNSPIFANNLYEATILESAGNGSFITSVSASDKDGISNGAIVYYILPNHYSNKFAVNSSTGDILVDSQLDYEAGIHTFILTVCANDTTTDSRQNDPGIQLCSVLKFTFPSMYVMT